MLEKIKDVLMRRDNLDSEDADAVIEDCLIDLRDRMENNCPSAYDICGEYFGLEPDYLDELIGMM
jgi:hypothetical protein